MTLPGHTLHQQLLWKSHQVRTNADTNTNTNTQVTEEVVFRRERGEGVNSPEGVRETDLNRTGLRWT
jgi:hypothetical protein